MTKEEKKIVRGFMFLSEKPILYVLNIGESTTLGTDLEAAVEKFGLGSYTTRPNTGATATCGKVEAELAEIHVNHLRRIELGQANPTYLVLLRICGALRVEFYKLSQS